MMRPVYKYKTRSRRGVEVGGQCRWLRSRNGCSLGRTVPYPWTFMPVFVAILFDVAAL